MSELTTFSLTCNKTMEELEIALSALVADGPIFMAQVRPKLAREGFTWVGSISDCVRNMGRVDVKWDSRTLPVDFLVLRSKVDDNGYLRRNPKFHLDGCDDKGAAAADVDMQDSRPPDSRSVIRRIAVWLGKIFRFRTCRIKQKHWNRYVDQLRANPSWTVSLVFNDGREGFTADSFVSGDQEAMMVQHNGAQSLVERKDILNLSLKKKPSQDGNQSGIARVTFWKFKSQGVGFGYLEDNKIGRQLFFTSADICDIRLKESLAEGKHGQLVQYVVSRPSEGKKFAVAQIVSLYRDYTPIDPLYQKGHRAMITGDLAQAEQCLVKVIEQSGSDPKLSALKDLAEVYNRQSLPQKAYDLIEKWRGRFRAQEEQDSFEMMEILYLERMENVDALRQAIEKIDALLRNSAFAENAENRRRHFEAKRLRLKNRIEQGLPKEDKRQDVCKETQVLDLIRKSHLSPDVLLSLGKVGCDEALVEKLRKYVSVLEWEKQVSLCSVIKDDINESNISPEVMDALEDEVDRLLIERAGAKSTLQLVNRNRGLLELDDGVVKARFALFLPDVSALPLRRLCVTMESREGGRLLSPCTFERLTYEQGKFQVELSYRPSQGELSSGRCEVEVTVSYEKDVKQDLADKIGVDEPLKARFSFRIGGASSQFVKIANPYESYCYHVAEGDVFVGREKLLEKISGVLEHATGGQSFVLYGQDRSGKTSIRRNLQALLRAKLGDRLLYTETTGHGWTTRMLDGDPVEYVTYDLKASAVRRLEELEVWDGRRQSEFNEIPRDYHSKKLEYLGECLHEQNIVWVVVIDEFTDLYDLLLKRGQDSKTANNLLDLLWVLKGLLESRKPTFNLFLIGRDSMPRFKRDYWNTFAVSKPFRVTRLEEDDTKQLLQRPLAESVEFSAEALDRFYYYVGGYPFYSMIFCSRLVEYINDNVRSKLTEDDIDNVAESFCVGDTKLRAEEFNPFFSLYCPEINNDVLMDVYYEVARASDDRTGCPKDLFALRPEHLKVFKELEARDSFHEYENGTVRLHLGLLGMYLRCNSNLASEDFMSAFIG